MSDIAIIRHPVCDPFGIDVDALMEMIDDYSTDQNLSPQKFAAIRAFAESQWPKAKD